MKALTLGSAMLDMIAIIDSDRIERMSMVNADSSFLLLEEGHKTEAEEISVHPGGGAVNAAVGLARLGFETAVLAKLGADARAELVLQRIADAGVSTAFTKRDPHAPTGAAVLVASHDRNAAVFTFRGANTLLTTADLDADAFRVDVVYIANLSNESADCFPEIARLGKANRALVAANPGPRQLSARGRAFIDSLSAIDVLILNRSEADLLVPRLIAKAGEGGPKLNIAPGEEAPRLAGRGLTSGGFTMSLIAAMRALIELGPRYVAITDGDHGAFVGTGDEIVFTPTQKARVVGTAGAGDAFGATLTGYLAMGRPPVEAALAASFNAASVVGYADTQTGLLKRDVIDRAVAAVGQGVVRRWVV
jgi:ribokinase